MLDRIEIVEEPLIQALLILFIGLITGFVLGRLITRTLRFIGLDAMVEGTASERWLQRMGTSTSTFIGRIVSYFIYFGALLFALLLLGAIEGDIFWALAVAWLPHLFVAILILVIGVVVAEKLEMLVSERLQGLKLPDVKVVPKVVKYTIIYIAVLIALSQVGVATSALLILLLVYVLGILLVSVVALQDFLASGAGGVYLFLYEPYSIGDEVIIGEAEGVVQEITLFVTHVESDNREYVIPNRWFIREGALRVRTD